MSTEFDFPGGTYIPVGSVATFDQSSNTATATTVQAAVSLGTLTLLTDVITACATLQTGVNHNRQLINSVIDAFQTKGIVS